MKALYTTLLGTFTITALAGTPTFTVEANKSTGQVSPMFYGLMTEEINHCYDGGLYAELIQNRAFLDDTNTPVQWSVVKGEKSASTITLDTANPFNDKLTTSLRVSVSQANKKNPAGVANGGYWGIPVQPRTTYRVTLIVRAEANFSGPLTVAIVSEDGTKTFASGKITKLEAGWKKYETTIKTGRVTPTDKARFQVTMDQPGTVWLALASLFPPTWNDQPNGFRKDLMQMMVDLKPKYLRFPGGNYLEGDTVETRFQWKNTLGPIEERHGHPCPWGYRSSDGLGMMEFLQWCEAMNAEPVLGLYAGYSLKGAYVKPGPDLQPFVQEALEEIEYVIGDTNTTWGARRAKDGHPAPFKLRYVEIGNEDWFDKSGSYEGRFAQFYDAIKAKYPQLKTISTMGNDQPKEVHVKSRKPDMTDEHYYRATDEFLKMSPTFAKDYDRNGPEIFVGEWAAHEDARIKPWEPGAKLQPPTPSMTSAIGDGAFMAAMERNSDIIKMHCYAPMFVNVNPGARQWRPNLIGYDALTAYGSPSYYAIQMFSRNIGDEILATGSADTAVQGCATRDSKTGEIFVKLVNPETNAVSLRLEIKGAGKLATKGTAVTLAAGPDDANSITEPKAVLPVTTTVRGIKPNLNYEVPPHSIVVLKLKARP